MVEIDTFYNFFCVVFSVHIPYLLMVGLNRLELLTSRLSGVRSNQLSYRPIIMVKQILSASALRSRLSNFSD